MPPTRSESSNIIFFTYKHRKVGFARPGTYEDALNLAKKTFTALKAIPPERICISARLPDHEEEGVVEIAPEAWRSAANGLRHFTVEIVDEGVKVEERGKVKKEKKEEVQVPIPVQPVPSSTRPGKANHSRASRITAPENQDFWVIVRHLTGRNDHIRDLQPSDDIYTLKKKVQEKSGICVAQQRLISGGQKLEEGRTLADYSIKSGAIVFIVLNFTGGKPVIYLYPPTSINAKVRLSLVPQWGFSAVYPKPIQGTFKEGKSSQTAQWDVVAHPSGMMSVEGSSADVAYIFWEAETGLQNALPDSPPLSPSSPLLGARSEMLRPRVGFVPGITRCSSQDSVVLSVQDVPPYLEKALLALGLHTEARTSFITYWLPSFLKHEHVALRFVPQVDYEASAPLNIDPKPDVVTRVFMLFEGILADGLAAWEEARERSSADVNMWRGIVGVEGPRQSDETLFRVLEWGGMEVR